MLPPTASPEARLTARPPPAHYQTVTRRLSTLGIVFVAVGLSTWLVLPSTCNPSLGSNPANVPITCWDTSGSLPAFLSSLAFVTLLSGLAILLVGFLSTFLIRRARSAEAP